MQEGAQTRTGGIVSETQSVLDLTIPPTGSLSIRGNDTATLSHVVWHSDIGGQLSVRFGTPPGTPAPPFATLTLTRFQSDRQFYERLDVDYSDGASRRLYSAGRETDTGPPLFIRSGYTYTVDTSAPSATGTTSGIVVSGSITVGHREIRAAEESVLKTDPFHPHQGQGQSGSSRRVTFGSDGVYRLDYAAADGTTTQRETGTWEQMDDTVVISYTSPTVFTRELQATWEGSDLILKERRDEVSDPERLRSVERNLDIGLRTGTLQASWYELLETYSPLRD